MIRWIGYRRVSKFSSISIASFLLPTVIPSNRRLETRICLRLVNACFLAAADRTARNSPTSTGPPEQEREADAASRHEVPGHIDKSPESRREAQGEEHEHEERSSTAEEFEEQEFFEVHIRDCLLVSVRTLERRIPKLECNLRLHSSPARSEPGVPWVSADSVPTKHNIRI
jgi:hypothetical protein